MKLNGWESSVLAFLAQRPRYYEEFERQLGYDARRIARALVGYREDQDAEETACEILRWAREKREREAARA